VGPVRSCQKVLFLYCQTRSVRVKYVRQTAQFAQLTWKIPQVLNGYSIYIYRRSWVRVFHNCKPRNLFVFK